MSEPVTVVVATKDRDDELERSLDRLLALPERPAVVVVDNGSSDDTVRRAEKLGASVIECGRNLGAAARNIGVEAATTPVVALADDDSYFAPGALGRAAQLLEETPGLALVAASVLVGGRELDPTCEAMARSPLGTLFGVGPGPGYRLVLGFLACGAVLRRDAFLSVGGFAPWQLIGGEEELVAMELVARGWKLVYAPDVVAEHHPSARREERVRRRLLARNALWAAWLRRSRRDAWRLTGACLKRAGANPEDWAGIADAIVGLPRVWRHRRPVPPWLEQWLRTLESQRSYET